MTVESKICAGACVLSTYFVNDISAALTNQTPCLNFVLFCFTATIILAVAFIVVIIICQYARYILKYVPY